MLQQLMTLENFPSSLIALGDILYLSFLLALLPLKAELHDRIEFWPINIVSVSLARHLLLRGTYLPRSSNHPLLQQFDLTGPHPLVYKYSKVIENLIKKMLIK